MLILRRLLAAIAGWRAVILGEGGWSGHFLLSRRGLVEALIVFSLFGVLFSFALQSGNPHPLSLLVSLGALLLYPAGLAIAAWVSASFLRGGVGMLGLMVPGTYALILFVAFGTLAAFTAPVLLAVGFIVNAILMTRLGQAAGGMSLLTGAAFAALVTVLLVGLPISLYMLASFELPPA
jgi:hypothetical protein